MGPAADGFAAVLLGGFASDPRKLMAMATAAGTERRAVKRAAR